MISVKVIKDSINENKNRLTTLELIYPRFIHAEMLRHRLFSRNVESSRAKPINKNIEECMHNPVIPRHWTMNQAGMVGKECTDLDIIQGMEFSYKMLAYGSAQVARQLADAGLHKQVVNRILEPYIRTKELVTASEWENFLKLRTAPDAEPHIQDLAHAIKEALDNSVPSLVLQGEWHLPYIEEKDEDLISEYLNEKNLNENYRIGVKQRISAARCARISYKAYDGTTSIKKDLALFDKLYDGKHMSPLEHVATPLTDDEPRTCNFIGWTQLRKKMPFDYYAG